MVSAFAAGEGTWRARLGTMRQVVRQELVARQLAAHLGPAQRVLDVGCGQGSQLLVLARRGHQVTGLDSSAALLAQLRQSLDAEPPAVRGRVSLLQADAGTLGGLFRPAAFDAVLCHGVLMYLPDPGPLLTAIAAVTARWPCGRGLPATGPAPWPPSATRPTPTGSAWPPARTGSAS
jgi:ubiquinone/menaquinone biosynthesis C-methylase UbiE